MNDGWTLNVDNHQPSQSLVSSSSGQGYLIKHLWPMF